MKLSRSRQDFTVLWGEAAHFVNVSPAQEWQIALELRNSGHGVGYRPGIRTDSVDEGVDCEVCQREHG